MRSIRALSGLALAAALLAAPHGLAKQAQKPPAVPATTPPTTTAPALAPARPQ